MVPPLTSVNIKVKLNETINDESANTYKTSHNMIFRHDVHKFCEPVSYDFGQFLSPLINKYTNGGNHPGGMLNEFERKMVENLHNLATGRIQTIEEITSELKEFRISNNLTEAYGRNVEGHLLELGYEFLKAINENQTIIGFDQRKFFRIDTIACVYTVPFDRIYKSYTRIDKLLIGDPQNTSAMIPDHVEPEIRNKRSDQPRSRIKRFVQRADFMNVHPNFFRERNITSMPDLVVEFNNTIAFIDGTNCSRPQRTTLDTHGWQFISPIDTNCASGSCKTLLCSKSAIVFSFNYNASSCLFGKTDEFLSTTCIFFDGHISLVKYQIMDLNDMLNKRTGADATDLHIQEVFSAIGPWKVFDTEINQGTSVSPASVVVNPISESTDHQKIWIAVLIALLFLSLSANFLTVLFRVGGVNVIQQYRMRYANSEVSFVRYDEDK
ncbi:hypothetical protein M3Y96_00154800 [Aphelenchoides besseyi]|nr:hypothetical protein M3Y96_00154800 [Aphelenchoides besseyi]